MSTRATRAFAVTATIVTSALLAAPFGVGATPAAASVSGGCGQLRVSTPPPVMDLGQDTSDTAITLYQERQDFSLPSHVAVDITPPPSGYPITYNDPSQLTPSNLAPGTVVDSWYVHAEPNNSTTTVQEYIATIRFTKPILGVMVQLGSGPDTLDVSDSILGAPNTTYVHHFKRGLEMPHNDVVNLEDPFTIRLDFVVSIETDDIRIVTAGTPLSAPSTGYRMVASDGGVFDFGNAGFFGSTGGKHLNQPVVAGVSSCSGAGYWLVASDGGIFNFGDAKFHGSTGSMTLNKPIVGMAPTHDSNGYWLFASDGGVFSFGDASFLGSMGAVRLNRPVVGAAADPLNTGYWMVASDGGIFTFGQNTKFFGSTGAMKLNKPVVGMAPTPDGQGYWLVASDGGIFSFGDAHFYGSTGSMVLNKPIIGMKPTIDGQGYWLVASDGGIFSFGDAPFYGSTGNIVLNKPIVSPA